MRVVVGALPGHATVVLLRAAIAIAIAATAVPPSMGSTTAVSRRPAGGRSVCPTGGARRRQVSTEPTVDPADGETPGGSVPPPRITETGILPPPRANANTNALTAAAPLSASVPKRRFHSERS